MLICCIVFVVVVVMVVFGLLVVGLVFVDYVKLLEYLFKVFKVLLLLMFSVDFIGQCLLLIIVQIYLLISCVVQLYLKLVGVCLELKNCSCYDIQGGYGILVCVVDFMLVDIDSCRYMLVVLLQGCVGNV